MAAAIRIVGCGRWSMGDDRAGLLVAERLSQCHLPDTEVSLEESPTGLADPCDGVELLVIVDAARADERHSPGSTLFLDYRNLARPAPPTRGDATFPPPTRGDATFAGARIPSRTLAPPAPPTTARSGEAVSSRSTLPPHVVSGGVAWASDSLPVRTSRRHGQTNSLPMPPADPASATTTIDGHSLGVRVGLELAEALGTLPPEVWIYVLFGTDYQRGFSVSQPVADGIQTLARRIETDVRRWIGARTCTS